MLKAISPRHSEIKSLKTSLGKEIEIKSNHDDLSHPTHLLDIPFEKATFGMGCFWGAEALYGARVGILRTRVGYSGGTTESPKYRQLGDHTEVLEIDYNPKQISYKDLLDMFWNNHEYGLSSKVKRQYMSLILYHNEEQKEIAEASREEERVKRSPEEISTVIAPAGEFYPGEDYHQKYRLQSHKELAASLGLTPELLQVSFVATKLNGYLVGVGGVEQFLAEVKDFGLNPWQKEYVKYHVEKNEGSGLFC